ncbi:MAG: hypothetical protein NT053_14225 [Cyanobacteria bacterium]|nr:hypothetical protein [Cyanobacteriota bacterium]
MPVVRRNEPWEVMFREEVSGLASGWTVREHRGKVKLVVRRPDQGMESITLPFPWAKASMGDAYSHRLWIENFHGRLQSPQLQSQHQQARTA